MKKFTTVFLSFILIFSFAPAFGASAPAAWAEESFAAMRVAGLPVDVFDDYSAPISRLELCVLEVEAVEAVTQSPFPEADGRPFTDTDLPLAAAAAEAGLINGRGNGIFDPDGAVTREEAAKLFVTLARFIGLEPAYEPARFTDMDSVSPWAAEYVTEASAYGYMNGDENGAFLPAGPLSAEQAVVVLARLYAAAAGEAVPAFSQKIVVTGDYVYDGDYKRNDPAEVFTDGPITTKEEADAQMTEITVDIWELEDGEKVPGKLTLTVHKNIAEVTKAVFADIFNGPEKFPIDRYSTYCYSFRTTATSSRLSEHATGTAIDINPDQNYCVYPDGTTVGSLYAPGENPYSITKFGDCWTAFVSHGFTWGGDAWSSPQDYMHFSYLGK